MVDNTAASTSPRVISPDNISNVDTTSISPDIISTVDMMTAPRLVTPTASTASTPTSSDEEAEDDALSNSLESAENADLKALLSGFISPELLARQDLLVNSTADVFKDFRGRIQTMGCSLQKKENEDNYTKHFSIPASYKQDDITKIDPQKHSVLTKRSHIPMTVAAVRDVAKAPLQTQMEARRPID